jgi:hypothetical protein
MTRGLFDISEDLLALADLLEEQDGDITETEAAFDAWFAQLGSERDQKLDGYAWLISTLESDAETLKSEIERIRARKSAFENKAKGLKARLEAFLKIQGIEKIQTTRHTFALQKPGGKPKFILADLFAEHPEELPEGFRRVKFEADLNAIREAVETDPENNSIYGHTEESEKRLRIR